MRRKRNKLDNWGIAAAVLVVLLCLFDGKPSSGFEDKIYSDLAQSVVMLHTSKGGGTGFLTRGKSGKPVLVTNWHVCRLVENGALIAERAKEFEIPVRPRMMDTEHDLCVLDPAPGKVIKLGKEPHKFSAIYIMGHPLLKPLTPSFGLFSGEIRDTIVYPIEDSGECAKGGTAVGGFFGIGCAVTMDLGDTTAPIFPGNSGSPAVDANGDLIGVINSSDGRTGWGAFIPLRYVRAILDNF